MLLEGCCGDGATVNATVHYYTCTHAQSCLTLCDPSDCSPLGSSVRGILLARILEWVSGPSSRGSARRN